MSATEVFKELESLPLPEQAKVAKGIGETNVAGMSYRYQGL